MTVSRPRLATHVVARRHFVDGSEFVVLFDESAGRTLQLGARAWTVLAEADGTRDAEGIALAAQRMGVGVKTDQVVSFLADLDGQALLEDGPPTYSARGVVVGGQLDTIAPDRPVEVLPRFALRCDGRGGCCSLYGTVLLTPNDVARARAFAPTDGPVDPERLFTPARGSAPHPLSVPATVDGACMFLDAAGRCGLHCRGGMAAKPMGCGAFPLLLADDGERVRASVAVECGCVLSSLTPAAEPGEPIIPGDPRTVADLPRTAAVDRLASAAPIAEGVTAERAEIRQWTDALVEHGLGRDTAAALWALAAQVERDGLDPAALGPGEPPAPDVAALVPWFAAVSRRASARLQREAWRNTADRVRRAWTWVASTATLLRDPEVLAELLSLDPPNPEHEAFYVRAQAFVYRLFSGPPLATALRDRAVRLWLARAMPAAQVGADAEDSAFDSPLAVLEVIMRGHGLARYVAAVTPQVARE